MRRLPQPVFDPVKMLDINFYCKIDRKFVNTSDTQCKLLKLILERMRIIIIINIIIIHQSACGETKMASKKVNICRFCNSAVAPNNSTQLFSTKSLSMNLPVRLSTLL